MKLLLPQSRMIRQFCIVFAVFCLILILPEFLTGLNAIKGPSFFYSPSSYLGGIGLTLTAASFSLLGCIMLHLSPILTPGKLPFLCVFVGQVGLFLYMYVRSAINHYIFHVPVTIFELIAIFVLLLYLLLKAKFFADTREEIYTYKWQWLVGFTALFLLGTALCEHETPRAIMLSSDPDQHAFFALQIMRYGMVPYTQFDWGPLPFRYPAGSGLLGFLWSVASGLDVRDAITIQPLLQAYIAIFMLMNVACIKGSGLKITTLTYFAVISLFSYLLTYSMDSQHYHLEGTGRLSSIAMFSSVICFFMVLTKEPKKISIHSLFGLLLLFNIILLYGVTLNPINVIYAGLIFGVVILAKCGKKLYRWPLVMCLFLIVPLMSLDPYYGPVLSSRYNSVISLFTKNTTSLKEATTSENASKKKVNALKRLKEDEKSEGFIVNPKKFDLSFSEIIENYRNNAKQTIRERAPSFFSFNLLPGKYTFLLLIIIAMIYCSRFPSTKAEITKASAFLVLLFVIWLVITPFFKTIAFASAYRLLKPYFQYNTFQYLFCLLFLVLIMAVSNFVETAKLVENRKRLMAISLISLLSLMFLQVVFGAVVKSFHAIGGRVNYCGSLGCVFDDDKKVIAEMETYYKKFMQNHPTTEATPRILLPNMAYLSKQVGYQEHWIFPTGASRMLPFSEVFHAAFFYKQAEWGYSNLNYNKYVCESFDLDWLKTLNIQFLFIPTDMMESCIYDLNAILKNSEVLSNYDKSYFIKLY